SDALEGLLNGDIDASARLCELDGVGKQIPHDLFEPVGISPDLAREAADREIDVEVARSSRGSNRSSRGENDCREVNRRRLDAKFASHCARDVEQVVDENGLRARVSL